MLYRTPPTTAPHFIDNPQILYRDRLRKKITFRYVVDQPSHIYAITVLHPLFDCDSPEQETLKKMFVQKLDQQFVENISSVHVSEVQNETSAVGVLHDVGFGEHNQIQTGSGCKSHGYCGTFTVSVPDVDMLDRKVVGAQKNALTSSNGMTNPHPLYVAVVAASRSTETPLVSNVITAPLPAPHFVNSLYQKLDQLDIESESVSDAGVALPPSPRVKSKNVNINPDVSSPTAILQHYLGSQMNVRFRNLLQQGRQRQLAHENDVLRHGLQSKSHASTEIRLVKQHLVSQLGDQYVHNLFRLVKMQTAGEHIRPQDRIGWYKEEEAGVSTPPRTNGSDKDDHPSPQPGTLFSWFRRWNASILSLISCRIAIIFKQFRFLIN